MAADFTAKEITALRSAFFWERGGRNTVQAFLMRAHVPRRAVKPWPSVPMRRHPPPHLHCLPFTFNIWLLPQGSPALKTHFFQSQCMFWPFFVSFISLLLTGILPTTVLGRVQSPDLDDWSEKVYRFEGKPSRYFDLIRWKLWGESRDGQVIVRHLGVEGKRGSGLWSRPRTQGDTVERQQFQKHNRVKILEVGMCWEITQREAEKDVWGEAIVPERNGKTNTGQEFQLVVL